MALVFVYGDHVPGALVGSVEAPTRPVGAHPWFAGLPARAATVRGSLWVRSSGATRQPGLLPAALDAVSGSGGERDDAQRAPAIPGALVEVPDARLATLDLLVGGNGLVRRPIVATSELRGVTAQAWVLAETPRARSAWRPLGTTSWRRVRAG
jgi:hypothetical protein